MGCRSCGGSVQTQATSGRWVLTLADGTELPYATEPEVRDAQQRNPGSTYAWVTTVRG